MSHITGTCPAITSTRAGALPLYAMGMTSTEAVIRNNSPARWLLAPVPPCAIYGHAGVLASVIENLTRNAVKYMGERTERRVDVRVEPRGSMVRVEVEDSGPGIPPALYDTIFDPHVRGRTGGKPGIGLGLATVKRIAEAHGGSVGFRSKLDVGTTFWIELPRADYDDDSRENRASAQAGK